MEEKKPKPLSLEEIVRRQEMMTGKGPQKPAALRRFGPTIVPVPKKNTK